MKYKLILILLFTKVSCLLAKDSTINLTVMAGTYTYLFNNDVKSPYMDGEFIYKGTKPLLNYSIGIKGQKNITKKKQLTANMMYSNAKMQYLYNNHANNLINKTGNIQLNTILINTYIQYNVFKWLKLNYGFSHSFNLINRFDHSEIAKEVNWNDSNNKSRMKKYSFAVQLGIEFKLYKNLSLELNSMSGLNVFTTLNLVNNAASFYKYPQRLVYQGLTLNYRIK